jgi:8-amino-3,8-dideoxy-alpha-D-manno-octulosonate transaminase
MSVTQQEEQLAIHGGPKAVPEIIPSRTKISAEELWEIVDMWDFSGDRKEKIRELIFEEGGVCGPHLFRYYNPKPSRVSAAEEAMKGFIGTKHCLATNSCTSALVAAYRALGVGAGDEVIVPAYTFFASASTVVAANGIPVIVDIDDSLNLDPQAVEKAITKRTKAILPVHMRGSAAQMDAIMEVANKHGIPVVEDVAQACGGTFKGKKLGSIGAMGCFSFDYYKIIVSGEGGFITTDDEWLHTRAQSWHDCAACWRPDRFAKERREGELFCGENYRMSELEGAVAVAQIRRAGEILGGHRRAKARIKAGIDDFRGLEYRRLTDPDGDTGICLVMYLPDADVTERALEALQAEGVPVGGIYDKKVRDWHIYKFWEQIIDQKSVAPDQLPWSGVPKTELPKYSREMCPRTLDLLSRALLLDVDSTLTDEDCDAISGGVNKVFRALLGN